MSFLVKWVLVFLVEGVVVGRRGRVYQCFAVCGVTQMNRTPWYILFRCLWCDSDEPDAVVSTEAAAVYSGNPHKVTNHVTSSHSTHNMTRDDVAQWLIHRQLDV